MTQQIIDKKIKSLSSRFFKLPKVILISGLLAITSFADAEIITFNIAGALGFNGSPLYQEYQGANFSGTVGLDTDSLKANTSSSIIYNLSSFAIDLSPLQDTPIFSFFSDAEEGEFDSNVSIQKQTGNLIFSIFENIDNPDTIVIERRLLRLDFDADTGGRVQSIFELLAADANFGDESKLNTGLVQFTTSGGIISTARASATAAATPNEVSTPATLSILMVALSILVARTHRTS